MVNKKNIVVGIFFSMATCSLSDQCGKEVRKINRISGGYYTVPNQYPWMVTYTLVKHGRTTICGGSLITERLVLTAKHCVVKRERWGEAKVGSHDRRSRQDKHVEFKEVFLRNTKQFNDIAILLLTEPVDLNDPNIGTVCLPETENEDYIGKRVKAIGWGMSGLMTWEYILKAVDLVVSGKKDPYLIFTKVGKINGVIQDPCAGDSGGPLVYKKDGRWTLIGTVLGGGYNCNTGLTDGLGVYNKITSHLTWIKEIMQQFSHGIRQEDCSCSDFVSGGGYGQCKKMSPTLGALTCYVNLPSNCSDRRASQSNPGKYYSADACNKDCSCSNFISKGGYGQCKKITPSLGALICYVNLPSSCSDRRASQSHPGKYYSADACNKGKYEHNLNGTAMRSVRQSKKSVRLGRSEHLNKMTGTHKNILNHPEMRPKRHGSKHFRLRSLNNLNKMAGPKCAPKDSAYALFLKRQGKSDAEIAEVDTDEARKERFKNVAGNDGIVSYEEFMDNIKQQTAGSGEDRTIHKWAPRLFELMDMDGDGSQTYEEIVATRCRAFIFVVRLNKVRGKGNRARGQGSGHRAHAYEPGYEPGLKILK